MSKVEPKENKEQKSSAIEVKQNSKQEITITTVKEANKRFFKVLEAQNKKEEIVMDQKITKGKDFFFLVQDFTNFLHVRKILKGDKIGALNLCKNEKEVSKIIGVDFEM